MTAVYVAALYLFESWVASGVSEKQKVASGTVLRTALAPA